MARRPVIEPAVVEPAVEAVPNPNPFFAELPAYEPTKPEALAQLEQELDALRAEAERIDRQRADALEDHDLVTFLALDKRMAELPDQLVTVEVAFIAAQIAWLETFDEPLRALAAEHLAAQDRLFAEQERISLEMEQRATVLNEISGRVDLAIRRRGDARRRRQEVLFAQMVKATGGAIKKRGRRRDAQNYVTPATGKVSAA